MDREFGELRELVEQSIDKHAQQAFGAYLFTPDQPGIEIGRDLERRVFLEAFGNTSEQLAREYGDYDPSSIFICVIDHRRGVAAGAMRLVLPTSQGPGLKSLNDVQATWGSTATEFLDQGGVALCLERTWDIATLAVDLEYRSAAALGLVSLGVYQTLVRTAHRVGVESFVTILDHVVFRLLRMRLRQPFLAFAEARPYLGSELSVPAYCFLDAWMVNLEVVDPTLHEIICEGRGLEPALLPTDIDDSVKRVLERFPSLSIAVESDDAHAAVEPLSS